MAYNAKKTEHSGPKKGRGAYLGRKAHGKKASSRVRRQRGRKEAADSLASNGSARKGTPNPFDQDLD